VEEEVIMADTWPGVYVSAHVYRDDREAVGTEEVMDALIDAVEEHGWYMGGVCSLVDMNEVDDDE